jgi:hypothetical protein
MFTSLATIPVTFKHKTKSYLLELRYLQMPVANKKKYCPLSCLLVASLLPFSFSFAQEDGGLYTEHHNASYNAGWYFSCISGH